MEEQIINVLELIKNGQLKEIDDIESELLFPFNGLLNNLSSILNNPVKISDLSIEELKKVLPDFDINIINKLEMYKKLSMLSYFPLTTEQKNEIVDIVNNMINDLNNKKEFLIDNNEDIKDKKNIIEIIESLIDKINNLYNGKNYLTSLDIDNIALYLKLSDLSIDKQMAIIQDISLKSLELINSIKVNKEDEEVTLLEETNLSESDVFDLFDKYNYNFDDFKDKDKVQLLKYGNLSTINDILKVFSDNEVSLYIKGFSSKLVQILLHSNGNIVSSIMSNLKDDCTENKYIDNEGNSYNVSLTELLNKYLNFPSLFINGKRAYYKSRSGGKKKIVDDLSLDDKRYVTGAYDNYIKNRKLFISRGINPTNIIKDCPSVFCLSYNKVKENFDSFDFYKIPPEIYKNTLSSLQAVDPLSSIDQFIEVGCYEYILSNFSYINRRSDDLMFYRIVKAGQMNKDIYSNRRTQKVQFISSISNDKNNEFNLNDNKQWILILYDISQNHYVGVPVYNEEKENSIHLKSINKYAVLDEITDYNRSNIKICVYIKGKPIKITNKEIDDILLRSKISFLNYVKDNTNNDPDGISYNKWCKDKLELINKNGDDTTNLKVGAIYWVDLGYNIGSELRKLRPAILWRSASNKKMWTAIPLTSKHKDDNYYFHYDLLDEKLGTARLENLINISSNRIREPYYINNKIATITKIDNDAILKIIKKYYAFEEIKETNGTIKKNNTIYKSKENREKVLT